MVFMKSYIILGVVILVIIVLVIWIIKTYNNLVQLRNKVKDQWSQVDVQLKKRFDLIPNIVQTVKGYANHEKETLKAVVDARNIALGAKTPIDEMSADNQLSGALNKLLALSESYPELKADSNFRNLQENLKEVEDKISFARQFYNDTVLKYKNAIEIFPTVLIAGMLGFKQEQFFEATTAEKENVKVQI